MPSSNSDSGGPLACPRCAETFPLSERFCSNCGMPLVYSGRRGEQPITETHERARKIKPQYARGDTVKVGFARNQAEAEMIAGMLLEEGIPSMSKRSRGFDVPDYLAGGPRDILVPETGAEAARELLAGTELLSEGERRELRGEARLAAGDTTPGKLAFWVLAALAAALAIVWLLYQATT
jgi:Putative prokaryotic signal transducing protein